MTCLDGMFIVVGPVWQEVMRFSLWPISQSTSSRWMSRIQGSSHTGWRGVFTMVQMVGFLKHEGIVHGGAVSSANFPMKLTTVLVRTLM